MLLGGGISGCIGVIIFAIWGNKDKWLPEHANNFFGVLNNNLQNFQYTKRSVCLFYLLKFSGWSFILGVIGAIGFIASSTLFLTEANVYHRKLKQLKDSQARFELERSSKI